MTKRLEKSIKLKERADKVIPHQTGTFSRAAGSFVKGVYPMYIQSANGSKFFDVDDIILIFTLTSFCPLILLNF